MARTTLDAWIPEEKESRVIQAIAATSVIESEVPATNMGTDTRSVNRSAATHVEVIPKGGVYGEDGSANDDITLKARKYGKVFRLAEEDIEDSPSDIIGAKKAEWGSSFSKTFDNACLGVTAAENGTTVPHTSLYRALATADAGVGYTANANILTAAGATATYDELSDFVAAYEASPYFDQDNGLVIMHPSFRGVLRKIKDDNGNPIFVASPREGDDDRLFGYRLRFSAGAQMTSVATDQFPAKSTAASPLAFIGNRNTLVRGVRSGPESVVIDGRGGASALTDETLLKMRARRGFAVGDPRAWVALKLTIG